MITLKHIFTNRTGKILTAIAAGMVTGGISRALVAPEKGSETRRKMNKQGKKIAGELKHKFCNCMEKCKDGKEQAVNEKAEAFS